MASSSPSAYRTTRSTQSRSTSTGIIYEAVFGVDFEMFEEEEREMRARRNGESA